MTLLVHLDQASLRVRDRILFEGITWKIRAGEHWAVVGPNGAGKSTLVRALIGEVAVVRGTIFPQEPARLRQQASCLSFEHQRRLMALEDRRAELQAFSGRGDDGARVGDFIRRPQQGTPHHPLDFLERIQIAPLLDRRIRELSSGEMRRFQIALALSADPSLLILDEPYEGLDPEHRAELARIINALMDPVRAVVLVTHRRSEIPPNTTHVIGVKAGRIVFQGRYKEALHTKRMRLLYAEHASRRFAPPAALQARTHPDKGFSEVLIDLRDVTVRHYGVPVFENLSWTVRKGEHWAVSGPNGSGKTTLLSLIVGDHPQAYANTIRVFGNSRGGGGSIRETKSGIGHISPELQIRYRKAVTAADVVTSGFFDSIGLYRNPSAHQQRAAEAWMEYFGLRALAEKKFNHLSQGEQRMLLLARALVKPPRLLVLDEPCQGLDAGNRRLVLQAVDRIAATGVTTILFVSHHPGEIPACITHCLRLVRKSGLPSRAVVTAAAARPRADFRTDSASF